jgi:hypothetical protein
VDTSDQVLFTLDKLHVLGLIASAGQPIVHGLLGLPDEAAEIFVMGFLRRDYGAAGLFRLAESGQLSAVQAVVALTVMTLFIPCIANFLMIVRERGARVAFAMLAVITPIAVVTGAGLNVVLNAFGITFRRRQAADRARARAARYHRRSRALQRARRASARARCHGRRAGDAAQNFPVSCSCAIKPELASSAAAEMILVKPLEG